MPLVEPLLSPFWPEGDPVAPDPLPAIASPTPTRSSAGVEWSVNWMSLEQVLGELRALLGEASVRPRAARIYGYAPEWRVYEVADALARGPAQRPEPALLADLGWLDELFGALVAARQSPASATGVNLPPLAMDESYPVAAGATLSVGGRGVLANDFDPNGAWLSASLVRGPAHAADFQLAPDGSFSYTPKPGFAGVDRFTYRMSDGELADEGEVTFSVLGGGGN